MLQWAACSVFEQNISFPDTISAASHRRTYHTRICFDKMLPRIVIFLFVIIGIDLYAYGAFVSAFGPSTLLTAVYFSVSALTYISFILYGNYRLRERLQIPRQLAVAGMFLLFVPKFFISIFLLTEDVFRVIKGGINLFAVEILKYESFQMGLERSFLLSWVAISFTALLMFAFLYGALFNVYNYKIRKVNLKLIKLPKSFDGLRVVQISDIHSGSLSDKKAIEKAVQKINDLRPDLVFFTGDLVNNIAVEAEGFVDVFSKISAKHGVYSILGNHDYGDYMYWQHADDKIKNLAYLKSLHQQMGWRLLLNEHVHIEKNNEKIIVAGVENWSASNRFPKYGKLQKALDGIHDAFTILLLSHDPSHWKAEIIEHPAQIDVTFSGHTHGMQFGFEFFGIKWSPVKYFYKQWAGLYEEAGQYLYVNRGFGVIGYPGRVGILPEITLFTLQSEKK
ncbi:MAG: metallophosphoesterase [Chitinophagales bacterium]|nr:metallophosphoesterase [Chitinophagales bacterium]